MKKIISLILALTMVMALAVSASATSTVVKGHDAIQSGNPVTGDVKITVSKPPVLVYNVDISWESLTFEYQFAGALWDPTTHTYEEGKGDWVKDTKEVTVKNHSNAPIVYTAELTGASMAKCGVAVSLDGTTTDTLKTAEGTAAGTPPQGTFNVKVANVPNTANITDVAIDELTVTISLPTP